MKDPPLAQQVGPGMVGAFRRLLEGQENLGGVISFVTAADGCTLIPLGFWKTWLERLGYVLNY